MKCLETSNRNRWARTTVNSLAPLALAVFALALVGCSDSPTAPADGAAYSPSTGNESVIAFSSSTAPAAGKIAGGREVDRTAKKVRPDKRASLKVKGDGWRAILGIPKGAVTEPVRVTMAGSGTSLSNLSFAFEPTGLVFDPHARLSIVIDNDLVDVPLDDLTVIHFHADGSSEPAKILSITTDDGSGDEDDDDGDDDDDDDDDRRRLTKILIDVPGFSRYGVQNSD